MLYDKLAEYSNSGVYPMHMPGHKRNPAFLRGMSTGIDITEIHGFDNLHDPQGILCEVSQLAEQLYGSDRAFLLINGSTAGILASVGALAKRGDKALVMRGCHVSVYNAITLFGIEPVHIAPEICGDGDIAGSVSPTTVSDILDCDGDIKLVIITSPTYEGVTSDVKAIAKVSHDRGVPLLVDSAHGAHFGFSHGFPKSAVSEGADVVVMSLHKTLPALTQCSLLHVSGNLVIRDEIARLLSVFQTSSPSYVLMASIDCCMRTLAADKDTLFAEYERRLAWFYKETEALQNLSLLWNLSSSDDDADATIDAKNVDDMCAANAVNVRLLSNIRFAPQRRFFALDPGKLVIIPKNYALTGTALADKLRDEHKIELEKSYEAYAIAMTSICDTDDGFRRLAQALREIDAAMRL